jgi:hypothetical protein
MTVPITPFWFIAFTNFVIGANKLDIEKNINKRITELKMVLYWFIIISVTSL